MSPHDAMECVKDFVKAFPRAARGELAMDRDERGRLLDVPKLAVPGRLMLEGLLPLRISREQWAAMLREVANTQPTWQKAKAKIFEMARAASRQRWIDSTQTAAAVAAPAEPIGLRAERPEFVKRPGESMLAYAERLLVEERDHLSNDEVEAFEAFVARRAASLPAEVKR